MSFVTDYLATLNPAEQAALEQICEVVRSMVPDVEEGKSYSMPAFKYQGRPLLGFIASKDHLSLFPFSPAIIEALHEELKSFSLSKGTIRFSPEETIPEITLRAILQMRLQELNS